MRSKRPITAAAMVAVAAIGLSACSSTAGSGEEGEGSAALMIPGTSGDGGFFDQAIQGVRSGANDAGWQAQVVEAGYEPTRWEPALTDLSSSGTYDVVITGSFAVIELVQQAAASYPDQDFVIFDAEVDAPNVYSITYRYDETGFLAGVLAGLMETTSGIDRVSGTGVVGVVGGQDIPVINEYIDGFTKGVAAVAPDVRVLSAYAGSFSDPVKGKAVADDMVSQGAEIIFTAAGATDQGVIESAASNGIWAIGNAAAQADSGAQVNGVDAVLTASDTNVGSSLSDAVSRAAAGDLPVGTTQSFGVADGAVSIIDSPIYDRVVPAEVREQLATITQDVADGQYESLLTGD